MTDVSLIVSFKHILTHSCVPRMLLNILVEAAGGGAGRYTDIYAANSGGHIE
jgi:hypothetical protein